MKKFTIAILVNNQFGVLNRVTSMFRRRQFNITSLTVSETESEDFSRITVQFEGDEIKKEQLINQLYKLPDVCSVAELDTADTVNRELLLIKVIVSANCRSELKEIADIYKAKIVDLSVDSMILELTGKSEKIDGFLKVMVPYEIVEMCRTGITGMERGMGKKRG